MTAVPPELTFDLPAGWTPVPPEAAGVPGIAFIGVHETTDAGFTANVTVGAQVVDLPQDGTDVPAALGAQAVARVETTEQDVVVRRQQRLGTGPTPGLAQEIGFSTDLAGQRLAMTQIQVFLLAPAVEEPQRHVLWTVTFTATDAQAPALAPDVEALVRTIQVGAAG